MSYEIFVKRIRHLASVESDPQLEHSLCTSYIGDADYVGCFNPSDFEGLCFECLKVYLRREGLALTGVTTAAKESIARSNETA